MVETCEAVVIAESALSMSVKDSTYGDNEQQASLAHELRNIDSKIKKYEEGGEQQVDEGESIPFNISDYLEKHQVSYDHENILLTDLFGIADERNSQ